MMLKKKKMMMMMMTVQMMMIVTMVTMMTVTINDSWYLSVALRKHVCGFCVLLCNGEAHCFEFCLK